jgi:hypothetical protein
MSIRRSIVRAAVSAAIAAFTLCGAAHAHGAGHLMGTAESVSADRLVVKDQAGATHEVRVGPATRYRDGAGSAAKASDVQSGDRVVVHLGGHDADAPAKEVQFQHSNDSKSH